MKEDSGLVIKDEKDNYYCGLNKWDKQLRKAKIYHSERYAKEYMDRCDRECHLQKIVIREA